jgi:hypothetical protein
MSDRHLRALERELQVTGSEEARWNLHRALQRYGKAAEYYAQIFLGLFWDRFKLSMAFDIVALRSNRLQYVEYWGFPDCFSMHFNGILIGAVIEPTHSIGTYPDMYLSLALDNRGVSKLMFPGDKQARVYADEIFQNLRIFGDSFKFNNLYDFWVNTGEYPSYVWKTIPEERLHPFIDEINEWLVSQFIALWSQAEEFCDKIRDEHRFIRGQGSA